MLPQRRRHPVRRLPFLARPQFPRRRVRSFQHFACHANRPRLFRQIEQRHIQPLAVPARRNPRAFVLRRPQRMGTRARLFIASTSRFVSSFSVKSSFFVSSPPIISGERIMHHSVIIVRCSACVKFVQPFGS